MNYLGNYASYIKNEWIDEILSMEGKARPRDWPPAYKHESYEYDRATEAGYDLNGVHWYVIDKGETSFEITFPFLKNEFHWWITKLYPGQFMPMHSDPHVHERNAIRYWMPLQDYVPGHIFIINDQLITGYKKGDMYSFVDSQDIHGAANIGHTVRLSLLITDYL